MEDRRLYVMAKYDEETEIKLNKIKKALLMLVLKEIKPLIFQIILH